jgi:hypothetical protein
MNVDEEEVLRLWSYLVFNQKKPLFLKQFFVQVENT